MRVLSLVVSLTGVAAGPSWQKAWSLVPNATCTNVEMCAAVVDMQVDNGLTHAECVGDIKTLKRCLGQVKSCDTDAAVVGLTACCEYLQGGNSSAPACPTDGSTPPPTTASAGKGKAPPAKGKNTKAKPSAKSAAKAKPKATVKECRHTCFKSVSIPSSGVMEKSKCLNYVNSLESCIRKVCPDQEDTGIAPCCKLLDGVKSEDCSITKGMPKLASTQTWISAFADGLEELTGQSASAKPTTTATASATIGGGFPGMSMPGMPGMSMPMPGMSMPGMSMPGMSMPGMSMPGMSMPSMPGMSMPGMPGMSMPGMSMPGGMPGMPAMSGMSAQQTKAFDQSTSGAPVTRTSSSSSSSSTTSSSSGHTINSPLGSSSASTAISRTAANFNKALDAQDRTVSQFNQNLDALGSLQSGINSRIAGVNAGVNNVNAKLSALSTGMTFPAFGGFPTSRVSAPTPSMWNDDDYGIWG